MHQEIRYSAWRIFDTWCNYPVFTVDGAVIV